MVDPILVGALVWLGQQIASAGVNRLVDRAIDGPSQVGYPSARAFAPIRRHNLNPAGGPSSDVDVTVLPTIQMRLRQPVILTFQDFGNRADGVTYPMLADETAHVTVKRGHYLLTALVVDLPRTAGALPTLRGIGWSQPWIASNATSHLALPTRVPTEDLLRQLGLTGPGGRAIFQLPVAAAPAQKQITAGQTALRFTTPTAEPRLSPAPPMNFLSLLPLCRAQRKNGKRCRTNVPVRGRTLCFKHGNHLAAGRPVYDYETCLPITKA